MYSSAVGLPKSRLAKGLRGKGRRMVGGKHSKRHHYLHAHSGHSIAAGTFSCREAGPVQWLLRSAASIAAALQCLQAQLKLAEIVQVSSRGACQEHGSWRVKKKGAEHEVVEVTGSCCWLQPGCDGCKGKWPQLWEPILQVHLPFDADCDCCLFACCRKASASMDRVCSRPLTEPQAGGNKPCCVIRLHAVMPRRSQCSGQHWRHPACELKSSAWSQYP